jgi:hypothetical protein
MRSKALVLASGLSLALVVAAAQSSNVRAQPMQWRDGYVEHGKLIKANWRMIDADDGARWAVDLNSIKHGASGSVHLLAYLIEGDAFDPDNLQHFGFDCRGAYETWGAHTTSRANILRTGAVQKHLKELACTDTRLN